MLLKSKEELNGTARIILNNLDELYCSGLLGKGEGDTAQSILESAEWVHIYNLIQRMAFINNSDPHFGVLGEIERLATAHAGENNFNLRYEITRDGIVINYVSLTGDYLYTIEVWCIDRAIKGLALNMPSGVKD